MRTSDKTPEDIAREEVEKQRRQEAEEGRHYINLEDLAGLSDQQINNYIDNNVTDLDSIVAILKKLAKWNRALTRILMLRQDAFWNQLS